MSMKWNIPLVVFPTSSVVILFLFCWVQRDFYIFRVNVLFRGSDKLFYGSLGGGGMEIAWARKEDHLESGGC